MTDEELHWIKIAAGKLLQAGYFNTAYQLNFIVKKHEGVSK